MNRAIAAIVGTTIVIIALAVWYIVALLAVPTATVQASTPQAGHAALAIDIVANAGAGPHPDWVQYQTSDLNAHQGATIFKVPVNTWVTMTVKQYDSATGLRNSLFSLVQGTQGNIAYLNGKPFRTIPSDQPGHTFAVPGLGLSVPLQGVPSNASSSTYEKIQFTFFSGRQRHTYHWQCFVPCGWGAYGNGGPMSTFGYMGGWLVVG
jgi:hypothetical protein